MVAVGIDLGTAFSCVAVWRNGVPIVIPNERGNPTTPSYVAFTQTERLIGDAAKNQSPLNPRNTIFGAKRLIGRRYDDVGVQMDLRHWPYRVINENGKPIILVDYKGEKKKFAPEEVSGMLLYRLKQVAEAYLKTKVENAVITVPAYFNDAQRQATRVAGILAGLNVLRIINEPTAAALAYGVDKRLKGEKNVLIYDLGGGTLDVSILNIAEGSMYEVKSTAGNTRLGGEDFDNRMVAYFAEDFRKRYNIDILGNPRALRRLKSASEKAKRCLTTTMEASVQVDSLSNNIDYSGKITRELFEELCSDLFRDTLKPMEQALKDSKLSIKDIHEVVLVGGSTRIPRIRSMLLDFFKGLPMTTSINPDEAVACGAAIQAAILSEERHEKLKDLLLVDVVPLSLGVEVARGLMFTIIERNATIPCRQTKELTTLEDYQSSMTIEVFEGERSLTKDNNLLGLFDLNILPAPRGVAKIDATFDIDVNGILTVSARDRGTGSSESLQIRNEHRLKKCEIEKMMADAEKFKEEDNENRRSLEARNQLENYVYEVKNIVVEKKVKLSNQEHEFMTTECSEAIEWLDDNVGCLREEYERKMTELMTRWTGIMKQLYTQALEERSKRQRGDSYQAQLEEEVLPVLEINDDI